MWSINSSKKCLLTNDVIYWKQTVAFFPVSKNVISNIKAPEQICQASYVAIEHESQRGNQRCGDIAQEEGEQRTKRLWLKSIKISPILMNIG